ncbi:MAG: hypothetical protein HYU66_17985 [Armatimonadetes bacterium]|nr:hypothetical protein [Armatimonadota bacterium]
MKTKAFDCVDMMHEGAAWVRSQLQGLTPEQRIAWWAERSDEFREYCDRLRREAAVRAQAEAPPAQP